MSTAISTFTPVVDALPVVDPLLNKVACGLNSDSELSLNKTTLSAQIAKLNQLKRDLLCLPTQCQNLPASICMFRHMTIKGFMNSTTDTLDKLIERFLFKNERGNLQKLTYSLFSGRKGNLSYGLTVKLSNLELALAIKKAYKEMQETFKREFENCPKIHHWQLRQLGRIEHFRYNLRRQQELKELDGQRPDTVASIFDAWCKSQKQENEWRTPFGSGDTEIMISHGGGYLHIIDFLCGKSKGYKLENTGYGIQVSPHTSNRAAFYAKRASEANFDQACVLTAKIAVKYLDKAPNTYVAGLRAEYVRYLQDLRIELLPCEILQQH